MRDQPRHRRRPAEYGTAARLKIRRGARRRSKWVRTRPERDDPLPRIEQLYEERLPEFRRVAAAVVGDRELALDVVQDAFALAVRKREGFRGEGSLEAWLWRILVNTARTRRRRATPELAVEDALEPRPDGHGDALRDRVRNAVALLPERQRLVLFLRYYADLDYATIADTLSISQGTVGATLTAANARMHELLEEVRS